MREWADDDKLAEIEAALDPPLRWDEDTKAPVGWGDEEDIAVEWLKAART